MALSTARTITPTSAKMPIHMSCPTCLICRERLMSEAVPTEEHDRRCTLYVTERGVMEPET